MNKFVKVTKNPLTWIAAIGVGLILIIWWTLKKAKEAVVD